MPLNARVDATRLALAQEELRAGRAQLARIVRALDNVSLGIRLDVGGEKLYVADDTGSTVPDRVMAAAMAALVFRSNPGCTVAVTVDQPDGLRAAGRDVRRPGAANCRSTCRR